MDWTVLVGLGANLLLHHLADKHGGGVDRIRAVCLKVFLAIQAAYPDDPEFNPQAKVVPSELQ